MQTNIAILKEYSYIRKRSNFKRHSQKQCDAKLKRPGCHRSYLNIQISDEFSNHICTY